MRFYCQRLCILLFVHLFSLSSFSSYQCSNFFQNQKSFELNRLVLNQSAQALSHQFSAREKADIIMAAARGEMAYPGFSAALVRSLQSTLKLLVQAEMLKWLVKNPYLNEKRRRENKPPINAKDYFGSDVDLSHFDVRMDLPRPEELRDTPQRNLDIESRIVSASANRRFISAVKHIEPFIDIGMALSAQRYVQTEAHQKFEPTRLRSFFDLAATFEAIDPTHTTYLFNIFLREAVVRRQIESAVKNGQLNRWPKNKWLSDLQILLLASHVDLIPLVERLPDLDFRFPLNLSHIEEPVISSNSPLRESQGALAALSVRHKITKGIAAPQTHTVAEIAISPIVKNNNSMSFFSGNLEQQVPTKVKDLWSQYLERNNLTDRDAKIVIRGDFEGFEVEVVSFSPRHSNVELAAEFFIMATTGKKVNERGRPLLDMSNYQPPL